MLNIFDPQSRNSFWRKFGAQERTIQEAERKFLETVEKIKSAIPAAEFGGNEKHLIREQLKKAMRNFGDFKNFVESKNKYRS